MVLRAPFVRWDMIRHGSGGSGRAGVYYLQTAEGERVVCAEGIPGEGNHMTYRPFGNFLQEYRNVLPSGSVLEWNFRFGLAAWLDGIVYYSFLQSSEPGVDDCWHFAAVGLRRFGQRLPPGLRQYFRCSGLPTWILVVHGYRVCPIEVIDQRFCDGWDEFYGLHQLGPGFKIIFACERKWIFHTVILDENDREVRFHWSGQNMHHRKLHPPLVNLRTSCLPSSISHEQTVLKFGHLHLPVVQLRSEFDIRLSEAFHEFGLEEMVIRMANRVWNVPVNDMHLDAGVFDRFLAELRLDYLDYLLVIMLPTLEFRIVVFPVDDDFEKIYSWF